MMKEGVTQMNRQAFVSRLRAWAARADHETIESRGTARVTWRGQANVLHAVANVAVGGVQDQNTPKMLRLQIIADRQKTLGIWDRETDEEKAAEYTGMVQGYDLILELLKDATEHWD